MSFKSLIVLSFLALAALATGCSKTSDDSAINLANGSTAITNCTTTTNGQQGFCLPGLTTQIYYSGYVNITNSGLAQNFIQAFPSFEYDNISPSSITQGYIVVLLQPTSSGPNISITINFPNVLDRSQPGVVNQIPFGGTMGLPGVVFPGYSSFTESTAKSNSNAAVGTMTMQPYGTITAQTLSITSLQPWDGSVAIMPSVTVMINNSLLGTANLNLYY